MPHMVIFRDVEGRAGYHQADGLDDAVRFVEQLRNEQNISETRIFSMQEVPIEFRPYYRVTLAAAPVAGEAEVPAPPPAPEPVAEPDAGADAEAVPEYVEEPEVATVGASADSAPHNGSRFGLFGRS